MRLSYLLAAFAFAAVLGAMALDSRPALGRAEGPVFAGVPRVIDGDGLEIGGVSLRLHGIDAPEMGQTCTGSAGPLDCGALARDGLVALIGSAAVSCAQVDVDRYDRPVVQCIYGPQSQDLNARLVAEGFATAYRRYSTRYVGDETAARAGLRGIWATDMMNPEDWRHGGGDGSTEGVGASRGTAPAGSLLAPVVALRPAARPGSAAIAAPLTAPETVPETVPVIVPQQDCIIKGNISENGRIYHLPGQAFYDRTRINTARGERWFCTEAEAQAAGWRRARA